MKRFMLVQFRQLNEERQPIFGRNKAANVCTVQRNIKAPSCFNICSRKEINITYCECMFVALGIQREIGMRHIVSSVACQAPSYFSTLPHKW
jgi:hypothetical protein